MENPSTETQKQPETPKIDPTSTKSCPLGLEEPLNLLIIGMAGSGKTTFMGVSNDFNTA